MVRLNDAVGDTLDRDERDSFRLFPNTAGFQDAFILALPGPEFYARVTRTGTDSATPVFLRIMPTDLERIRFLIDNHESVAEQQRTDSVYAQALASFWRSIEDNPLLGTTSEPPVVPDPPLPPTQPVSASALPTEPVTSENRYNYALHGTTIGSAAGGCVGSHVAIEQVGHTDCGDPIYEVNHPLFWSVACGLTAFGSVAGYGVGDKLDRKAVSLAPPLKEGSRWRTGCTIGAAIPGLILGTAFFALAGSSYYGKTQTGFMEFWPEIENDPNGLTALPMVLTGLCITVEVATIGYRIGRAIDRGNAEKAEARRRALGH